MKKFLIYFLESINGEADMKELFLGSCEEELKHISEKTIDLVLVDPPYCTLGHSWDTPLEWNEICKELKRICNPKAAVLIFCDYKSIFKMQASLVEAGLKYRYFFIWDKVSTFNNAQNAKTMPINSYEFILVFSLTSKSPAYYTDGEVYYEDAILRYAGLSKYKDTKDFPIEEACLKTKNLEEVPELFFSNRPCEAYDGRGFRVALNQKKAIELYKAGEVFIEDDCLRRRVKHTKNNPRMLISIDNKDIKKEMFHPTQKSVELLKKLISLFSKQGDTVLDFCMGSGSSGVAALQLERNFIGIERDKNFFEIANRRMNDI